MEIIVNDVDETMCVVFDEFRSEALIREKMLNDLFEYKKISVKGDRSYIPLVQFFSQTVFESCERQKNMLTETQKMFGLTREELQAIFLETSDSLLFSECMIDLERIESYLLRLMRRLELDYILAAEALKSFDEF